MPGLKTPFPFHLVGGNIEHSGLGRRHHDVIMRDDVTSGPQSVAIERGADHASIGERNRRRTIPRLHQRSVILVERPLLRLDMRIARPCLRNQHGHHVRQTAPRLHQQLHGIVEAGGIAAARRHNRKQLADVLTKQWRRQDRLARIHPVHVAANRVDFAVVRNVAVGMRKLPARKCIRRETLVNQAESAGRVRIGEIAVEITNLRR